MTVDERGLEAAVTAWLETATNYTRLEEGVSAAIQAYLAALPTAPAEAEPVAWTKPKGDNWNGPHEERERLYSETTLAAQQAEIERLKANSKAMTDEIWLGLQIERGQEKGSFYWHIIDFRERAEAAEASLKTIEAECERASTAVYALHLAMVDERDSRSDGSEVGDVIQKLLDEHPLKSLRPSLGKEANDGEDRALKGGGE